VADWQLLCMVRKCVCHCGKLATSIYGKKKF